MEIWLKNDKHNIRFPVLPSEYSIGSESNNTSVNINGLGEVNIIGKRKLKTVTFSALFPREFNSSICDISLEYTPEEYRSIFEDMKKDVCTLTMTEVDVTMDVTIEALTASENDGTGDVTIAFSFKEYRLPDVTRTTKKTTSLTYTTKKNDTLSKIAKSVTGKSDNWKKIYDDNKAALKKSKITKKSAKMKAGIKLAIRQKY